MNETTYPKYQILFDSLVRFATSKGVYFLDAQDLAADAIERALGEFDPLRGEFAGFCHFVLSNLLKNYFRNKKKIEPYPEGEEPVDPDSLFDALEVADGLREVRAALGKIMKDLSPEESTFLKHLQDVLDESGSRAISEAARRSGLTPAKGWDQFRMIRRKAKGMPIEFEHVAQTKVFNRRLPLDLEESLQLRSIVPSSAVLARFTNEQLERIESLLP